MLEMTQESQQQETPAQNIATLPLTEGPFILTLRAGQPSESRRIVLGGVNGSAQEYKKALMEIAQLPDGLSFNDLEKEATRIFSSHQLTRVAL